MKVLNLDIRRRNLAKMLSLVLGASSLVLPMTVMSACSSDDDEEETVVAPESGITDEVPEETPTPEPEPVVNITLDDKGIGLWSEFVSKAMTATADSDGNKTYAITETIGNRTSIKGFAGRANYEQIKALLASADYADVQYDTSALSVYFDYVAKDGKGVEIVPSMLDNMYRHMTNVNITNVNDYGEKVPVKFSSGEASDPEVIDLEQFYARLNTGKLTVPSDAIVTQNTTSVNLLGVSDSYLRTVRVSDSAKLIDVLKSPLFSNAKLDKLILNGDIKPVMALFDRENDSGNVSFNTDAYYQGDSGEKLSVSKIAEFVERGAYANMRDVNVVKDDTDASVDFSNATMSNVNFTSSVDLSESAGFDYVKGKGTLTFGGVLPTSMTYMDAENVVMDGAVVPEAGTDVTGSKIGYLYAKKITNVAGFNQTKDTTIGTVGKYKGARSYYDNALKNVFNISTNGISFDLITMLNKMGRIGQKVYS